MTARIHLGPLRGVKISAPPNTSKQMRFGLWERETYPYLRRAMRTCDWMVDIGAGDGEHCIAFAIHTAAAPIIAIDPGPIELLRTNIETNRADGRVTIDRSFIGTKFTRLDSLNVPAKGRGFIKIDADFCELDILQSGTGLLAKHSALLLIETHTAALEDECCQLLVRMDYRTKIISPAWWRAIIPETRALEHNRWLWAEPIGD
jgi:hypothetical protein